MSETILGWHFCAEDKRLGYGDGREIVGVTNATAERLKIARDKVLLGEDHS